MAAAKRKPTEGASTLDAESYVAKATAELKHSGILALSKLGPAAIRPQIVERLIAAGFEVSGTRLRTPLAQQLATALEDGATIAVNSLKSHLAGATPADIKRVLAEAVAHGSAVVVLRGKQAALTRPQAGLVTPQDLVQLKRALDVAQKAIAAALAAKPAASLLLRDLEELLPRLHPSVRPITPSPSDAAAAPRSALQRVLQAVADASEGSLGLAFVPRVIGKLAPDLSADKARQALLEAAQAGSLELRPEGGMARLSQAELDVCPKGALGVALAWARRVENQV